jgi:SAM-dependent methyltransferase
MKFIEDEAIRAAVRHHYHSAVNETSKKQFKGESEGCCAPSCCSETASTPSLNVGYSTQDLSNAPEGADLGLGCGNPQAIASLKAGEFVLDLGAGAGLDCFLAARQVGPSGRVIGVDMTPTMLAKARQNTIKARIENVEFRLGEIEHLPVADACIDVIISNCVINLSPDKAAVFDEAFRVLKPGGRLAISDVVALAPFPETLARSAAAYACCISGAPEIEALEIMLGASGFSDIRISINEQSYEFIRNWLPGSDAEKYVAAATIEASKNR